MEILLLLGILIIIGSLCGIVAAFVVAKLGRDVEELRRELSGLRRDVGELASAKSGQPSVAPKVQLHPAEAVPPSAAAETVVE